MELKALRRVAPIAHRGGLEIHFEADVESARRVVRARCEVSRHAEDRLRPGRGERERVRAPAGTRSRARWWWRSSSRETDRAADIPRPGYREPTSRSAGRVRTPAPRRLRWRWACRADCRARGRLRARARNPAERSARPPVRTAPRAGAGPRAGGSPGRIRRWRSCGRDSRWAAICNWAAADCRAGTAGLPRWRGESRSRSR